MVTKGALQNVLAVCSAAETGAGTVVDIAVVQDGIQQHFEEFSRKGFRTLGVAYKNMGSTSLMSKVDEAGMRSRSGLGMVSSTFAVAMNRTWLRSKGRAM